MESNGNKRRKVAVSDTSTLKDEVFRPGNIVSLRIWNFTTYSYGEFKLSPTLNMIIGPNGTGKSTFVAAVCLGLGGKVDLIKRKTMDSMIKSGEKESTIQITLKNDPGKPNLVIERTFFIKQTKSVWKVDGTSSDVNQVRLLVKSFNIQLDNLCHFLPQERVAEFASLSPERLLLETERTIGDNTLLEKHQLLIELDSNWVDLSKKIGTLEETISGLEADITKFENEARKYQEYEDKTKEIGYHRKLLPYAKLQDIKEQMKSLKAVRDAAKKALQDFSANAIPLENHYKACKEEIKLLDQEITVLSSTVRLLNTKCEKASRDAADTQQKSEELKNQITSLYSRSKNQKAELEKTVSEKEDMERRLSRMEEVDEDEVSRLSGERQVKHDEKVRIEEEYDATKFEMNALRRDLDVSETRFRDERKKLENNDRLEILSRQGTRYRRELMENAYNAHILLRKEKKNLGVRYHEAPIVSCHVTHQKYAKYFEKVVDNNSLFALFFDNEDQYQKVSAAIPKNMNIPMRVVPNAPLQQPMPVEKLKQLGFDGYLSDFITGPDTVIRGLKHRSFLHCIPVALKPVDQNTINKLLEPRSDGKTPFLKFVVENNLFMVGRSRYGSRQIFYQTEHIGEAQLMGSEGLTEDVKKDIQKRLFDLKARMDELKQSKTNLEEKKKQQQDSLIGIDEELKKLDIESRALRKKKEAKTKLEDTIRHTESRIQQLSVSANQDNKDKIEKTEVALLDKYFEFSELQSQIANYTEELVATTLQQKQKELLRQQLENKSLAFQSLMLELDQKKVDLQEKYKEAKSKYDEYKKGDTAREIRQQNLTEEEREVVRKLAEDYLAQNRLSELYVLNKIEQLEDDISVLSNVDGGSLELLKSKRSELEIAERQLPDFKRKKEDLKERMENISVPWERELEDMVNKISSSFQKNFITVASDGQVEMVKLERYKDWKLEILVKFRENSELKVLDHQSQSGGERAVSTIFFIMSLQGLTNAPIRIVDEINQGMDPKNEKMAHKYLVHTACSEGLSQYFLVTPKLLTGLYYHPGMAIHCIFTGPLLKENGPDSRHPDFLDLQRSTFVKG
ncbi:CIC11C00000005801 [Sungouiella intermedia]|uniref:Structural maintenance of chromosomes protein 5 n=1 Tax=Sungouiella intermedia TaxID=45354 RepID=A0A1L0BBC7_9ASCO|nr:CIC11C00000005801 [[Candida] intermedia]